MTAGAVLVLLLALIAWPFVFLPDRRGIWRRSWPAAAVLVVASVAALRRAGQLGDAVGGVGGRTVLAGVVVGVAWMLATQIGHAVLCRLVPSFIERVRDLYGIAVGDRRRDVLLAVVSMALAEELVFRLVLQREFGIVVAVVAYTLVQTVVRNWALILAGAACGVVWGLLYAWQETLAAPLLAHVIWIGTLMFVWPLRGCGSTNVPEADAVTIVDAA